jgi:hypothetical protein
MDPSSSGEGCHAGFTLTSKVAFADLTAVLSDSFNNMAIQVDKQQIEALNGDPREPGGYLSLVKGGLFSQVKLRL